jgi:hypothetical protein
MKQPNCKECKYCINNKCSTSQRKNKGIPAKVITSPNWCPFKKHARRHKKKSIRALLRKELDLLVIKVARKRAGNKCEITGREDGEGRGHYLNGHHIIGRSNFRVRWNPDNIAILSPGKHTLAPLSAHKDPIWFLGVMIEKRGKEWYAKLQKEAYRDGGAIRHEVSELISIKAELEKELNGK